MNHTHPDPDRLYVGCPACIAEHSERVRRAEFKAGLHLVPDDALLEILMGRDHIVDDWQVFAVENEMARRAVQRGEVVG